MSIETAAALVTLATVYMGIGLLFAVFFVFFGVARVDPEAGEMPVAVRLLILPGCVIMWPLMLSKWLRRRGPPVA